MQNEIKIALFVFILGILLIGAVAEVYAVGSGEGGTGNTTEQKRNTCERAGGIWGVDECPYSCVIKRAALQGEQIACTTEFVAGCNCGAGKCWNGNACEDLGAQNQSRVNCEQFNTAEERIKCRLLNKGRLEDNEQARVPEACRKLGAAAAEGRITREQCKTFYVNVRACYTKEGREKVACFRRISGLGTAAISGNANKTALRSYVVALLYELENRVEEKQVAGEIDADKAAEIIALIVQIKEKIMNGRTRDEIRPMLQELKTKLNELSQ